MKIKVTKSIVALLFVSFVIIWNSMTFATPLNLSKTDGLNEGDCQITGETINYIIVSVMITFPMLKQLLT